MAKKRKSLQDVTDNRTFNIIYKNYLHDYCSICKRRAGSYFAYCGPGQFSGRHGSGKLIGSESRREFRTWKHNRKTQYKT